MPSQMLRFTCFAVLICLVSGLELKAQIKDHWKTFKKLHSKSYSPGEENKRQEIFKNNVEAVLQHNLKADLGEETYKLGINKFADMTEEEMVQNYMGLSPEPVEDRRDDDEDITKSREDYPETVDWRDSGYVGPAKNQKSCGSCWAFACVGAVEAHYGLAKKERVVLSEQNLLDCSLNSGCKRGGQVLYGFYWIMRHGINHAECYPYVAKQSDTCKANTTCVGATISDYRTIMKGNENDLLRVVATIGPVAVSMYAKPMDLALYSEGIYNPARCRGDTNHAVLVVGYGTENEQPYWLIKNSWGPYWGDNGYFKLARNAENKCSVASNGLYPIV